MMVTKNSVTTHLNHIFKPYIQYHNMFLWQYNIYIWIHSKYVEFLHLDIHFLDAILQENSWILICQEVPIWSFMSHIFIHLTCFVDK